MKTLEIVSRVSEGAFVAHNPLVLKILPSRLNF